MNMNTFKHRLSCAAAAALLSFLATEAAAAPLNISETPLFLTTGVPPNLMMAIDDSGSMDFEVLLRGNDGAAWWRTKEASGECNSSSGNTFVGCIANGTTDVVSAKELNFNNAGNSSSTWKKYAYLFPNGSGGDTSDRRRLADGTNDHFALPPTPDYAWAHAPEYNAAYFNPKVLYKPWPNGGKFTFADAKVTEAAFDPVFGGYGKIDLTQDFAGTANVALTTSCDDMSNAVDTNYYFRVFTGMVIPENACIRISTRSNWETVRATKCEVGATNKCFLRRKGSDITTTLNNNGSVAIRYFPATFYVSAANAPPASFGYTGATTTVGKAPDGTDLVRYEIKPANFGGDNAAYKAAIKNFANWFSYYRKRHQALRGGLGQAFNPLTATRVGGFTINNSGSPSKPDVAMGSIDEAGTRTALYNNFYENWVHSGGTPNRTAVANLIRNFQRTGDGAPITHSCQRNFGMLFTDGFSNPPAASDGMKGNGGTVGNADGGFAAPFKDGVDNTIADGVMAAYSTSLRPDLKQGKVQVPTACKDANHDARLDCNTNPHMNFYAITLGTRGLQFNPDASPAQDPFTTAPTWPTTFPARHPSAVDDLWHATINGRGQLLNAKSSSELAEKLSVVLRSIAEAAGSASSAAVNSGSINTDTRVFQASFDSKDWSGKLEAVEIDENGKLGKLTTGTIPNTRQIITMNADKKLVPFTWGDLDATRRAELDPTATATTGPKLVNYLRGSKTDEAPAGLGYRARKTTVLGDIVNSAPTFVGAPTFRYPDGLEEASYAKFRADNINRPHTVYVGANDGMLHAFRTIDTGKDQPVTEIWAYVPSIVLKNMKTLSDPLYTHRYFVDGTTTAGDAYINDKWRTMLAAGLNKGGQGIYALDVTDPDAVKESGANSVLHWEFTDKDDIDMGFSFSRPQIVRMMNGKWAAVFGNGYSNTAADGTVSTTGNAVLYIVDLATGQKIAKIDTGVGMSADPKGTSRPNGLSTPVVIDVNGDNTADYAYAGDLFGHLWKFDLTSADPAAWKVSYTVSGKAAPLFTAKEAEAEGGEIQAITERPNVSRGPKGRGLAVVFGTGKYFETGDSNVASLTTVNSFYGLLDPNSGDASDIIATREDGVLVAQSITNELYDLEFGSGKAGDPKVTADVRVTSANAQTETSRGWYIDLKSPTKNFEGEMQVSDPILRNGDVIFTTIVPNADPCENGGSSWLMELNLFTGMATPTTPFDINNNGKFDDGVDTNGDGKPDAVGNGVRSEVGIVSKPAPTSGEKCDYLIFPGTSGGTETRCRDPGARGFGRQSWRQAR